MTSSKTSRVVGWILSSLLAILLIGPSAMGKFVEWEGKAKMLEQMSISSDLIMTIGVVEIILAVLFVSPRTGFLAAILLTGYLGGATLTHLRVGEPFVMPIIIGIVMWIALGLRNPVVFQLARGAATTKSQATG